MKHALQACSITSLIITGIFARLFFPLAWYMFISLRYENCVVDSDLFVRVVRRLKRFLIDCWALTFYLTDYVCSVVV